MSRLKIFTLGILGVFMATTGFGCKGLNCGGIRPTPPEAQPVTLQYWGVWDSPDQIQPLIAAYRATHPTVKIEYRQLRYEEYERKLLEAWADDRGPDVFAIPVTWLKKYQARLEPVPSTLKIPVQELSGSIKKEMKTTIQEVAGLTDKDIKNKYVDVVYNNVVREGRVYGLPYSLDTLVTFYNRDLLEAAGIAEPMQNFSELVEQTPKLTKVDKDNKIYQSAVALGGTDNIPNFLDIVSNIMLQTQVQIKGTTFDPISKPDSASNFSRALGFYTDFSRPGLSSFSWSASLPNAQDMFAQGNLAYFFGYSYQADALRLKGLSFDWGVTNFPQPAGAVGTKYYTNYWVNVVAKKSKSVNAAWSFVQTTAGADLMKNYLTTNKRPTALRSLVKEQSNDQDLAVFASQVLTADNWYEGYDFVLAEQYFGEFIDGLITGEVDLTKEENLSLLVQRINQTYRASQ